MAEDFDDMDDINLDDLIGEADGSKNSAEAAEADMEAPKIKKIKVKKLVKKPVAAPVNEDAEDEDGYYTPQIETGTGLPNSFDLDDYLDGVNNEDQQAPSAPSNLPTANPQPQRTEEPPRFIDENDLADSKSKLAFLDGEPVSRKIVLAAAVVVFFVGFFFAKMFFAEEKVVQHGLSGVVPNPEVPKGRPRCGVAEKNQGCVLYIMNPQRQELNARDFYDLAAQLTGRQKFVIETGNMRYANSKIRPGQIVMLNIPPLQ